MKLKRITAPLKQKAKEVVKRIKEMPLEPEPLLDKPGYIDLTKKKPISELNKAFSVVIGQKSFAKGGVVLKRLRSTNNPHRIRAPRQTLPKKGIIDLAESTKPSKTYAKMVRALNKPKASILETLSKTTGLPSIEKRAAKARELTTRAGSSQETVKKAGTLVSSTKKTKGLIEKFDQNPGGLVKEGLAKTAENPILVGGTAAGWVPTIVSGGKVVVPFTTETAAVAEVRAKQNEKYNKFTKGLGKKFREGRVGNIIEQGTNTVRRSMPFLFV